MFGLKKEIKKVINRVGIARELEAVIICRRSEEVIAKNIKSKIRVLKYLNLTQTIEVEAASFSLGQRLRSNEKNIIAEINKAIGDDQVKRIRYKVL
jgi:hypothetical protein